MNQPAFICVSLGNHDVGSDEARAVARGNCLARPNSAELGLVQRLVPTVCLYVRPRRYKESRSHYSRGAAFTSGN